MTQLSTLQKNLDVNTLERNYKKLTFGGTTRYKCKAFRFMEDEFHPLWHTYSAKENSCEIKVNIKSFNIDCNDQLESSDYIWFDVVKSGEGLIAVCQLNKDIKFLLHGKPTKNMTHQEADQRKQG